MTTFSQWRRGEGKDANASDLALPDAARVFQGERAGFPARLMACIVDLALVAAVMFGIWLGISVLQLIFTPGVSIDPPTIGQLVLWGYFLAVVIGTVVGVDEALVEHDVAERREHLAGPREDVLLLPARRHDQLPDAEEDADGGHLRPHLAPDPAGPARAWSATR